MTLHGWMDNVSLLTMLTMKIDFSIPNLGTRVPILRILDRKELTYIVRLVHSDLIFYRNSF